MPRTQVDPAFPALLRALRRERGLSLRDLSRATYLAKSTLSELENAAKNPSTETAQLLDRELRADGQLAAMVTAVTAIAEHDRDRVQHVLGKPHTLDSTTTAALASALAAQRRLDDTLGPHLLLPSALPQWQTVMQLARDARGPVAPQLHEIAAEWTQFLGWLRAEARLDAAAVRTLTDAIAQADALGHGPLSAQARNFRGYIERQRGNPRGMVRYFGAAYGTAGASVLQRVGDAAQAAHGYGLLGEHRAAVRLLGAASDLVTAAEAEPPGTAYWLSTEFSRLNIGLAYLGLDERAAAAEHLRAGLAGLPAEQQGAPWAAEYRRALAAAETPDSEPLPRNRPDAERY